MSDKIRISVSDLQAQAAELSAIASDFENQYRTAVNAMQNMKSAMSVAMGLNMEIKSRIMILYFSSLNVTLQQGVSIANTSATSFENTDVTLRKLYSNWLPSEVKATSVSNQEVSKVGTYVYNGNKYNSLGFQNSIMSQNDYDGEYFGYGDYNEGCTATSWCMGLSIITGKKYVPTDDKMWINGVGATFKGQGESVWGNPTAMLSEAYNQLQNGKPSVFYGYHSFGNGGCMHAVTVVGVSESADVNNLKMSDLLVVDPWGGEVKSLNQVNYTSFPSGSRLITYSDELP